MANNPFAAINAAAKIRERGAKVDAAVEQAAPPAAAAPIRRGNYRGRPKPSSMAPRAGQSNVHGAPISEPLVGPSSTERARQGQTNPGQ
jgi:hypothetical protein